MKKRGFFPLFLLSAAILLPALTACRQGFAGDPRLYNGNNKNIYISKINLPAPAPFPDGSEDWNNPNRLFPASRFDNEWVLPSVSFNKDNIPFIRFGRGKSGLPWKQGYGPTREYTYNASDEGNRAQVSNFDENGVPVEDGTWNGFSIRPMTIYQYRGRNPLVAPLCEYNRTDGNMQRFRFYRFVGKSAGAVDLDQFVIAVDTYSKFVFAYAAITDIDKVVGQEVPQEYEPVELHSEDGRPFYEYDPIGYVKENGTVVRYPQYEEDMKTDRAVNYLPRIHRPAEYPDFPETETVARHDPKGQGRSPYYPGLYAGQTQTP